MIRDLEHMAFKGTLKHLELVLLKMKEKRHNKYLVRPKKNHPLGEDEKYQERLPRKCLDLDHW